MDRRISLAALGAALLTSACAPARITVKPEFWQTRPARVAVALTPRPPAGAHKVGAQGLLDMAINSGMASDLNAHLETVDVSAFEKIRDTFVKELRARGMDAVALAGTLDPARYPARAEDAPKVENAYGRDLGVLRTAQRFDAVVLLQVRAFGTIRRYYGFIPLNAPAGYFEVKGQMVDLKTGALLWQTLMAEDQATVQVTGEWDEPPTYPNLTAALRTAVYNGGEFLWREFFYPDSGPGPTPAQAPAQAAPAAVPVAAIGR